MTSHPMDDALAAFALGALDRDEALAVAHHVESCARCRAAVDELREAGALLAHGVPVMVPPAALRARVLAKALQQDGSPIADAPAPDAPPVAPPVASDGVAMGAAPPPLRLDAAGRERMRTATGDASRTRDGARQSSSRLPWLLAAASTVLAAGLGTAWKRERDARQDLVLAVDRSERALGESRRAIEARDSILTHVLGPEVETATLAATGEVPSLRLFWDRAQGVMVLTARRLPPAPDGRTYQLWGIGADGRPVSLGTFNTRPEGETLLVLAVPGTARYGVSAVTDEPSGGSPQPTTTPFLVGSWPAAS